MTAAASLLLGTYAASGQQVIFPYYGNGNATQDNCNCYTLTNATNNQAGSVWNVNMIDLNDPFDFVFSVYLGIKDESGADGIAFVLQPISTQVGALGGGIGFSGVSPSVGVTIDTWQNNDNVDPAFDHIAIQKNGDLNHSSPNNLAGPVQALAGNPNIEDGSWHTLRVSWDPAGKVLKAFMDGVERVSATADLISGIFGGNPKVYWGFTASTGGANNVQRFCTSLEPNIKTLTNQETCFGKPVTFRDSSTAFGKIDKWFWDFGDGTTFEGQSPPAHLYAQPGIYKLNLKILGSNGCLSDPKQFDITIGSDPFARIGWSPDIPCENRALTFKDNSSVQYGTINQWEWDIGGTRFTTGGPSLSGGLPAGKHSVTLKVRTVEGCISPVETTEVEVRPLPRVDLAVKDVCTGEAALLQGTNATPTLPVSRWYWSLGDGRVDSSGATVNATYATKGAFTVALKAMGQNGCLSDEQKRTLNVYQTKADAGRDTVVASGVPFRLQGSGGTLYRWTPGSVLNKPDSANPLATITADTEFELTAYAPAGCATTDKVFIRVFKGPEIYVPTAFTPNGDNRNDILKALPVGVTFEFLNIFDRWGNLVFRTTDPAIGWDGRLRSTDLPSGLYIWMTGGTLSDGSPLARRGTLQLIR